MHLSTIISVNDAPGSVGGTGETKQSPVFAEFIFKWKKQAVNKNDVLSGCRIVLQKEGLSWSGRLNRC